MRHLPGGVQEFLTALPVPKAADSPAGHSKLLEPISKTLPQQDEDAGEL
jgi:hypothetical protein